MQAIAKTIQRILCVSGDANRQENMTYLPPRGFEIRGPVRYRLERRDVYEASVWQ
jgi:hypothetical protein